MLDSRFHRSACVMSLLVIAGMSSKYRSVRSVAQDVSSILPPTHAAALLIDASRAPSSCETLSAFFPTLSSANSSEDSPNGRGADRWLDNTPAGRQSRAAQSALQGRTTKRSEQRPGRAGLWSDKRGNALDVCFQLCSVLVKKCQSVCLQNLKSVLTDLFNNFYFVVTPIKENCFTGE